jgi:hypothetical protein
MDGPSLGVGHIQFPRSRNLAGKPVDATKKAWGITISSNGHLALGKSSGSWRVKRGMRQVLAALACAAASHPRTRDQHRYFSIVS